jgi:hypothetical protein
MAVSFDLCQGNPGAATFMLDAYGVDMNEAEFGFRRMEESNITGSKLYILWNDCCGRQTAMAIDVMNHAPIDELKAYIEGNGVRGKLLRPEDLLRWMGQ